MESRKGCGWFETLSTGTKHRNTTECVSTSVDDWLGFTGSRDPRIGGLDNALPNCRPQGSLTYSGPTAVSSEHVPPSKSVPLGSRLVFAIGRALNECMSPLQPKPVRISVWLFSEPSFALRQPRLDTRAVTAAHLSTTFRIMQHGYKQKSRSRAESGVGKAV